MVNKYITKCYKPTLYASVCVFKPELLVFEPEPLDIYTELACFQA